MKILTKEQVKELLEKSKSNPKHHLMIRTFLETGLKVSELVSLQVRNILPGEIRIEERIINISNELSQSLLSLVLNKRFFDLVFESHKATRQYTLSTIVHMINLYALQCESIRKRIGSYALRNTFISNEVSKKKNRKEIACCLGIQSKSLLRSCSFLF